MYQSIPEADVRLSSSLLCHSQSLAGPYLHLRLVPRQDSPLGTQQLPRGDSLQRKAPQNPETGVQGLVYLGVGGGHVTHKPARAQPVVQGQLE